ncbi:hypothetical protein, partial [Neobacillus sp. NPDC093127]|uniref:hypothetical protein n=1 Tax=Neobacillus sp. NPDC093127 TaxID=3364296 RepID=UPI0037FB3354
GAISANFRRNDTFFIFPQNEKTKKRKFFSALAKAPAGSHLSRWSRRSLAPSTPINIVLKINNVL